MSISKDILYKKEDDETWTEWNNRLPTNEDKLDYIGEAIYVKIYDEDKEKTCKIIEMLLELGVEQLIPLLENNELLDKKIAEVYDGISSVKRREILQKEDKIRTALENVKIEIAMKPNKNGYVILAHDDYGGKEQVYGHAQMVEEALTIAKEAVKTGKRRQNQNVECKKDCIVGEKITALWVNDGKWYGATISKVSKIWRKGEQITQIDVTWDDGINSYSRDLNETQIKKIAKYNRFDSARIVDLDTQEDVEEFGVYVSDEVFGYP